MATSLRTSAKDMRECSVCLEDMLQKSPKLLECRHSFCMPCLSALAQTHVGTSGLNVSCPKCKHNTIIKSGKLSDLPDNFLLQEVMNILDEHTQRNYCFYCSMAKKEATAGNFCNTCYRFMCMNCSEKHKKTPKFANHEIILITREKRQEFCRIHNQVAVYVCSACSPKRLLCDVCMMLDEPCHDDEHLTDYTTALSQEEEVLRSKLVQCNVDDVLSKFKAKIQEEMYDVQENVVIIKQGLDSLMKKATLLIEESMDFEALNLAANEVNECKMKALKLQECVDSKLNGIHAITDEITKALKSFSEKETKTETSCIKPCSDPQILRKLLKIKHIMCDMMVDRSLPILCWPTKTTVSKLRATKKGRVVYVCGGNPVITEITADGKRRELLVKHTTCIGEDVSVDICDNKKYINCFDELDNLSALYNCDLSTDFHKKFPSFSNLNILLRKRGMGVVDICVCGAHNIMLIRPCGDLHRYNESSGEFMDYTCPYEDNHIQLTSVIVDGQPRFITTYRTVKTILLCDNEGNTIQTLSKNGSPFKQPRATTINAQGNILVADFETCKIVEITIKGEVVQDVLTEDDGLGRPVHVAYSDPYLWVAEQTQNGNNQLKCFLL